MQDLGYGLRRTPLLRASVNKAKKRRGELASKPGRPSSRFTSTTQAAIRALLTEDGTQRLELGGS
jgi:hypothetical protein